MIKLTRLSASLSLFAGTLLSAGVLAQSQETPQLERVIVTGSNIKRSDTETASPVQVLTRDDIEKTGKQSIQEVLRGVTADGQGSIPTSFTAGFASGSASFSLRGLGVNSTLVLINGRRMTTYGLADDGARTFVDLNTIPLEAVERIEVLKDGASAIYGADAVGGVVNLILRKTYNGATARRHVPSARSVSATSIRTSTTYSSVSKRLSRSTSCPPTAGSSGRTISLSLVSTTPRTGLHDRGLGPGRRRIRPMVSFAPILTMPAALV
jgi:outer membrane cobalamin receptor